MASHWALILLGTLCFGSVNAQNPTIDSLWQAVEDAETPEYRVDELNYLAEAYLDLNPTEAIKVSHQALDLSKQISYQEGLLYAYNNLGIAFEFDGQEDSAFIYLDKALPLAIDLGDSNALSVIKNSLGLYYLLRGNHPVALRYFQESLETLEPPIYFMDPMVTYNNIGVIHEELGDIEKATFYYDKAGNLALENNKTSFANLSFGYIEQLKENYNEAIAFYQKALTYYEEIGLDIQIGESLFYIGQCHFGNANNRAAKEALATSLEIYDRLGLKPDVIEIYNVMAEVCEAEGNIEEALKLYHMAEELARSGELNTLLVPVFKSLSRQYAAKNDFARAHEYQLEYQALNDVIFSQETKERIAQLETNYELTVNKVERERLESEQAEREVLLTQRTIFAVGSSLVTFLIAMIAGVYYRANRQKELLNKKLEKKVIERTVELERLNQQLVETNQELERFTYVASHDLKEPIRNISSFINLIQRKLGERSDENLQEYMGFVSKNTVQMNKLINDVLAYSRVVSLDTNEHAWVDLNVLMFELQANYNKTLKDKRAQLEISELPKIQGDKSHIFMVFANLLDNALKYNELTKPRIEISYTSEDKYFRFLIKDNGIGIDAKYHDQVFEMFRRMSARDKYEGTGIGLAICKKIVNKYGGKIGVESAEGVGSTFYFTWPKKKLTAPINKEHC